MFGSEHTTRLKGREVSLRECFTIPRMEKSWQNSVYSGLRGQYFLDIHDHFDFHINRKSRLVEIRSLVVEGKYRPKPPLFVRLEKSKGLCRRIAIPNREDALVLQVIVDAISKKVLDARPSKNAFFARSHTRKIPNIDMDRFGEYFWFFQWVNFSNKVFELSSAYPYLIITDIANYYDNINLHGLRNILSGLGEFKEEILDFLFYVLEPFSWRPDYLPNSGRGLPQINFDAPRLLAHAFLYEADEFVAKKTDDKFVRWMDDIDIPAKTREKAKEVLRDLDDLLMARGVRLNSGKTKILNATEARSYLLPDENRFLNILDRRIKRLMEEGKTIDKDKRRLKRRFRSFLKKDSSGRWHKLYKRYFTLFGYLRDPYLERYAPQVLIEMPELRESVYKYYYHLGPSMKRFRQLSNFVLSENCLDEVSVFQTARTFTLWGISFKSSIQPEIIAFSRIIGHKKALGPVSGVASALWLLGKYGSNEDLRKYIVATINEWRYLEYLSRQVAGLYPRLRRIDGLFPLVRRTLVESGQLSALSIIANFQDLSTKESLNRAQMSYLKHGKVGNLPYPFQKFLIVWEVVSSEKVRRKQKIDLITHIVDNVPDPIYRSVLQKVKI